MGHLYQCPITEGLRNAVKEGKEGLLGTECREEALKKCWFLDMMAIAHRISVAVFICTRSPQVKFCHR